MRGNTFLRQKRQTQWHSIMMKKDFRDAQACLPRFIPLIYDEQEKTIIPVLLTRAVNQRKKNICIASAYVPAAAVAYCQVEKTSFNSFGRPKTCMNAFQFMTTM
jgi:hypothetical protein